MSQKILEEDLETLFTDLLEEKDIFNVKGISRGLKGFPDRMVFSDNVYFVELKVGKEGGSYYKQTKMQFRWQCTINGSNGYYVLLVGEQAIRDFVAKIPTVKRYIF